MPVHDWTRVAAGIFHDFHFVWIGEIRRVLNGGVLPDGYYAMAEQVAGNLGLDTAAAEADQLAQRKNRLVILHCSDHRIIAMIEVVSPGNKASRNGIRQFVRKVAAALSRGYHFLVLDLFPPTRRDPHGIHGVIWEEITGEQYTAPPDKPLTLASYTGGTAKSAYVEPVAVGDDLIKMPLFLDADFYVPVPLEDAYQAAWATVPSYWRTVLESPATNE